MALDGPEDTTDVQCSPCAPDGDGAKADDNFLKSLADPEGLLKQSIAYGAYKETADRCIEAVVRWRTRMEKGIWLRVIRKGRLEKELQEALPVIDLVLRLVEQRKEEEKDIVIVDLCSGFGYQGMFLSELLPAGVVEKIVLLDKSWPMLNASEPKKDHDINWDHVWKVMWPIRLETRKNNLKNAANRRQLDVHLFERAQGPVLLLGIHLCGQLSLRAIELFNLHPQVALLVLKPCCLPDWKAAQQEAVWTIGGHTTAAVDVSLRGKYNHGQWDGAPRSHLPPKFLQWSSSLFASISGGKQGGGIKHELDLRLWEQKHYQTKYMLAVRPSWEASLGRSWPAWTNSSANGVAYAPVVLGPEPLPPAADDAAPGATENRVVADPLLTQEQDRCILPQKSALEDQATPPTVSVN